MRNGDPYARSLGAGAGRRNRARLQTLYTVAAATLAAIVPLVILAGFWVRSELNKGRHDTEAFLSAYARSVIYRLDGDVREQLSALSILATLPSVDVFDEAGIGRDVEWTMAARPSWTMVGVVDATSGAHLYARGGSWPSEGEGQVLSQIRSTRRPAVVTRTVTPGSEDVLLYVPVVQTDGVARAIVARVTLGVLEEAAIVPGDGSSVVTIVDEEGRVLGRSRDPQRFVGRPANPSLRAMTGGSEGLFDTASIDDEDQVGAYARSSLTGWVATVTVNRSQLDAASRNSVLATVGAVMLGILLIAILGVFVFHTIMQRRLGNERLAASRALGDLDARLLATTQDALEEQRKASSEREVLLREIYHRVKNNLQIVQSLLRLGSRDLKAEQREPFEAAVRRIGAMARVHTLLYNSPDLASIDFKDYLVELLRELSEGFSAEERSIEHVLEASSLRLPLDTAVPLAFIAVEILTNAFRHAFPQGGPGRINVTADHDDGVGRLWIEDSGVGLTAEQNTKRRLGLTIVGKLVHQIGGTIEEPEPGSSRFVITFPISADEQASGRASTSPVPVGAA